MAKSFVKITLATKVRLLFGAAVIIIIGAALVVPWLYMETMVDERAARAAYELSRAYFQEWTVKHRGGDVPAMPAYFTEGDPSRLRRGPTFVRVQDGENLPADIENDARHALRTFRQTPDQQLVQTIDDDEQGRNYFRSYFAVRARGECVQCHSLPGRPAPPMSEGDLMGMIRMDLPESWELQQESTDPLVARLVISLAGVLAFLAATLLFYFITTRVILSPVRHLKQVADQAAEGDLTVRSEIRTGDEFEQLGRSFDDMLQAVTDSQNQLRAANRALDLKLNELAEANVGLFEANRLKNEFLANVSHELRTPLNSIIGFAELVADGDDARMKRYGANIVTSARLLLRIINDLLDLARIEAGKVQVTLTRVSVADICETLHSLVTPLATKKNLRLSMEVAPDLPVVETDAGKVQQVLYNLLSNAIKFTPAGGAVTIAAGPAEPPYAAGISVSDTGPGISEAEQQRIFEKFYQLDRSVTREHSGTGLGLAIAKELTALLGGRLRLVSQPGQGATFTLLLPAEMGGRVDTAVIA